jgi:hypothetical protein
MALDSERNSQQETAHLFVSQRDERWQPLMRIKDFFNVYMPPFNMTVDALFCVAWSPVAPLKAAFPEVPFFSVLGRTPLVLWFARFKDFDYTVPEGSRRRMGETPGALPYSELGIGTLLRRRGFFVPSLYASSDFGVQLGLSYAMPKQPTTPIELHITPRSFRANLRQSKQQSFIWARFVGTGYWLAKVAHAILPLRPWPISFPSQRSIRAAISEIDRLQIAHIQAGRLILDVPWLSHPASFFPIGLYLRGIRLELPVPEDT